MKGESKFKMSGQPRASYGGDAWEIKETDEGKHEEYEELIMQKLDWLTRKVMDWDDNPGNFDSVAFGLQSSAALRATVEHNMGSGAVFLFKEVGIGLHTETKSEGCHYNHVLSLMLEYKSYNVLLELYRFCCFPPHLNALLPIWTASGPQKSHGPY